MELKIGEYFIPEGCTVKMVGKTIKVYQKKLRDPSILRCRDCKYCSLRYPSQYWGGHICKANTWGKRYVRNYTVQLSKKACDKFERKED